MRVDAVRLQELQQQVLQRLIAVGDDGAVAVAR